MTLHGLFFHIAHLICRSELFNFASDASKLAEERFEAMRNLMKLVEINNTMQQNEGNYDEELKQRYRLKEKLRLEERKHLSQHSVNNTLCDQLERLDDSNVPISHLRLSM
jgi:hypothetical protein